MAAVDKRAGIRQGSRADTGQPVDLWLVFAGVMLIMASIMRLFDALWAFTYKGAVPDNLANALFGHSLSTYGWLWLCVAVILFVCGIQVVLRSQLARWIGVVAAALLAISATWSVAYYPVWSLVYIAIGVLVAYALIVHGRPDTAA